MRGLIVAVFASLCVVSYRAIGNVPKTLRKASHSFISSATLSPTPRTPIISMLLTMAKEKNGEKENKKKYNKSNLPVKTCSVCGRPFNWRKKWADVWDEVKYCSDRCRNQRNKAQFGTNIHHCSQLIFNSLSSSLSWLLSMVFAISMTSPQYCVASSLNALPPSFEAIQEAVKEGYYDTEELRPADFARLDEQPDAVFYSSPRLVEHIAPSTVKALTSFHDKLLKDTLKSSIHVNVLDLCSSWVSHISEQVALSPDGRVRVTGLGMNAEELQHNPVLTDYIVQDLNISPWLPYKDGTYQLVLLQLSVDYLTRPVEALREAHRVLSTDGQLVISFSNRVFLTKVVGVWASKSDEDRIALVSHYLSEAGFDFPRIHALSLPTPSEPLYIVMATK